MTHEHVNETKEGCNAFEHLMKIWTDTEPSEEIVLRISNMLPEENTCKKCQDDQDDGTPNQNLNPK